MSKLIETLDEMISTLDEDVVFHGTTISNWNNSGHGEPIYFTSSRDDAESYADEAAVSEHYQKHHGEAIKDDNIVAIVIIFSLNDILNLTNHGAELQPDWGWANQLSTVPTWQQSLETVGSFCVQGFTENDKKLGIITPLS